MPYQIDETHDPKLESWVESANDPGTDFPIQNLPWCSFLNPVTDQMSIGVAIGDMLLDLEECRDADVFGGTDIPSWHFSDGWIPPTRQALSKLRRELSHLLRSYNHQLRDNHEARERSLISRDECDHIWFPIFHVPDYTDFYASLHHATNVGSMFRPDNPLLPNYKHIPIGYHGRASSIVVSGTDVRRPVGQQAPSEDGGSPSFGPCKLLDYEMEMGAVIAQGNELGESISIEDAEDHLLGMCILNDWSARDLQKWEYVPLGPFLAKNFASTVSAYVVTMEALAPFRCGAFERDASDPQPLAYMDSKANREHGGIDITVEVWLSSAQMREQGMDPIKLSQGSFKEMYWTLAQMVAHHSVNGCNLQPGDLLGSGTISGTTRDARGSLLELTWDGDPFANPPVLVPGTQRTPIELPTGEERKFLADGDEVVMKAYCERDGFRRIGFGECRGTITPARSV